MSCHVLLIHLFNSNAQEGYIAVKFNQPYKWFFMQFQSCNMSIILHLSFMDQMFNNIYTNGNVKLNTLKNMFAYLINIFKIGEIFIYACYNHTKRPHDVKMTSY